MQGVSYGMCLPSSCSLEDLRNILFDISWDNQARFTQVKSTFCPFNIENYCLISERFTTSRPTATQETGTQQLIQSSQLEMPDTCKFSQIKIKINKK